MQKVLAAAGLGSRRHCETLIGEGRVEVDGEVVRRFGARVDTARQIIRVDGRRIPARQDLVYLALNKPPGVLSTMSDPRGRPTIADFIGDRQERLFHVGRLDYDTEGLLLLTNDGELAHRLAHPRYEVEKVYVAEVEGDPSDAALGRLAAGLELDDGRTAPARVRRLGISTIELAIHEGRKHQVKRMCEAVGHPVQRLHRSRYAGLDLQGLGPGEWRQLAPAEVESLRALTRTRRSRPG